MIENPYNNSSERRGNNNKNNKIVSHYKTLNW